MLPMVRELRSHMLQGTAKNTIIKKEKKTKLGGKLKKFPSISHRCKVINCFWLVVDRKLASSVFQPLGLLAVVNR